MTLKSASARSGLGAALAASLADEKQSTAERFAKAERLHQLAAGAGVIPEQLAKPAAPARPTRAPREHSEAATEPALPAAATVAQEKVVRDAFSFPPADHARIKAIVQDALKSALAVNKSEVVRAGLIALQQLPADKRHALLASVEKMKPGRPVEETV
jgi:hypothetical protein